MVKNHFGILVLALGPSPEFSLDNYQANTKKADFKTLVNIAPD